VDVVLGWDGHRCISRQCSLLALICVAFAMAAALDGCALFRWHAAPPPSPSRPQLPPTSIIGVASWYGPGFNGKHTASGEIYDQEEFTAASTTLPLGTRALVTNLQNGRSVEVRINDRGPFVKNRQLDLSHAAAATLGIVNPGTARVRIQVIHCGQRMEPGYFVQVGSFSNSSNAKRMHALLSRYFSDVRVEQLRIAGRHYYRVRMGAFPDHATAMARATQTSQLGLSSIIERQ
jgi:rare lipoprotein A